MPSASAMPFQSSWVPFRRYSLAGTATSVPAPAAIAATPVP